GPDDPDGEAVLSASRAECLDVAFLAMTEVEVRTHDDPVDATGLADAVDELVGPERREPLVEAEHDDGVRARAPQQRRALGRVGQRGRRRAGRERLDRERIERRRERGRPRGARAARELGDERLVSAVYPIEHTNCYMDRPPGPPREVLKRLYDAEVNPPRSRRPVPARARARARQKREAAGLGGRPGEGEPPPARRPGGGPAGRQDIGGGPREVRRRTRPGVRHRAREGDGRPG